MKVLVIRQIFCGIHSLSSRDKWVERETEATDLDPDEEHELFGFPLSSVILRKDRLEAYLEPDKTFYYQNRPESSDPFADWSNTTEYRTHVATYLNEGWRIHA